MGDVLLGVNKVENKTVILLITSSLPRVSVGVGLVSGVGRFILLNCHSFMITFTKVWRGSQWLNVGVEIFSLLTGGVLGL